MPNELHHPKWCNCTECVTTEEMIFFRKRAIGLVKSHTLYNGERTLDPNLVVELLVAHAVEIASEIRHCTEATWSKKLGLLNAELALKQCKVNNLEYALKKAKEPATTPVKVTSDQSGRLFRED